MKKILFILFCFISVAASAQTKWIPFYGPARFYKQIQIDPVPVRSSSPEPFTIENFNDTLWIYDGSWNSLWPPQASGGTFTGDTIALPGSHDVKLFQDISGNFVIKMDGHEFYYEVVDNQTRIVTDQIVVDSLVVGNLWFSVDDLTGYSGGNDSTLHSGSLSIGQPTAKVLTRRESGEYTTYAMADAGTHDAVVDVTAGPGSSRVLLQADNSTVNLSSTGLAVSDSVTLTYATADRVLMTSKTKKIKTGYLPFPVLFPVYDTLFTAANATGATRYKGSIGDDLDGYELVMIQAVATNSKGTRIPSFHFYRKNDAGVEVNMTSQPATLTTNATINPTYKIVHKGDSFKAVWTFSGTGAYPDGIELHLLFRKP
jgi:hypothetical protein